VDAAPDDETATRIETEIRAVPGVRDVHDLRLRRSGGALRDDGHVTFDGHLTLSEAHRLTEAARARVCIAIPEVACQFGSVPMLASVCATASSSGVWGSSPRRETSLRLSSLSGRRQR
jgi:divalent metal cation (Fe/Co/Zn/Cd) transporter